MPDQRHSSLAVERAIRCYCAAHPHAADTIEGVRRWWLAELPCARAEVEAALDALVAAGVLGRRRLSEGTVLYFCRAPSQ